MKRAEPLVNFLGQGHLFVEQSTAPFRAILEVRVICTHFQKKSFFGFAI